MKKKLISLLLLIIIMLQVATPTVLGLEENATEEQQEEQIITFKDEKIKQKLISQGYDTNSDNEISSSEIEQVTYLEFYDRTEFDYLDDLEYITNLQTLGFYNMFDSTLDISVVAKLTNLVNLTIYSNTVEYGDFEILKDLTKLEKLEIYRDGTTTLDLSGIGQYTNIKDLSISGEMANLDEITKLVNLESLKLVVNNSQTQLDASISNNFSNLTKLVLSGDIINFEKIFENVNLTELEIFNYYLENEVSLSGIENLTKLTSLSISGNIVDIEGMANLTNLWYLSISNTYYETSTDAKEIFNTTSKMNVENIKIYCSAIQDLENFQKAEETKVTFEEIGGFINSVVSLDGVFYDENCLIYEYDDNITIDTDKKEIAFNTQTVGNYRSTIYVNAQNINLSIDLIWNVEVKGDTETEINIPDQVLKEYILNNHDYDDDGRITENDMINIQTMDLGNYNVETLEGLENAIYLKSLTVNYYCTNISAISYLTELESLTIHASSIEEIDCNLFKNLKKLVNLWIYNSTLTNVEQLSELTALEMICISYPKTKLADISFISSCTNLISIYLSNNSITDITPLENLENLNYVDLTNNPIDDLEENNARVLEKLRNNGATVQISEFDRSANISFTDEIFKQELIDQGIDLNGDNEISEYEMEKMQSLYTYTNEITNIGEIAYAKNLRFLQMYNLSNTNLDFTPISKLTNLEELAIRFSHGAKDDIDISFIEDLSKLTLLDISSNVKDMNLIYENTTIKNLLIENYHFSENPINLTGIEKMTNLSKLSITGYLGDITSISKLTNLKTLNISNVYSEENITIGQILELVENLDLEVLNVSGTYKQTLGIYEKNQEAIIDFEQIDLLKEISTEEGKLYDADYTIQTYSEDITIDKENRKITLDTSEIGQQQQSFNITYTNRVNEFQTYCNHVNIYIDWVVYTDGDKETEINIPDANLKQYLLEEHDLDLDKKITEYDLINIGCLLLDNKNISSLEGLENAINLKELHAAYNNITNITPIINLEKLQFIYLTANMLTDISNIKNVKWKLDEQDYGDLALDFNFIDFTEGNENYNALKELLVDTSIDFYRIINCQNYGTINKINEIVNLEDNLKNKLIELGADTNSDNNISRKELYWITSEVQYLDLSNCNITNLSGLEYLNIYELNLSENNITDITPLTKIKSVYYVDLSNNKIKNIDGIENCYCLQNMSLNNNEIVDITPLSKLDCLANENYFEWEYGPGVCYIDLSFNKIQDITSIKNWKNIWRIELNNNKIQDISVFKDYTFIEEYEHLYNINLDNNNINLELSKNSSAIDYLEQKEIQFFCDNQTVLPDSSYIGNINSELITFNVAQNQEGATYVSGQIVVVEWVDGQSTVPKVAPKMIFKSTDGTVNMEVFVTPTGTNTYYFDRFIEGIDTTKEYVFEITSGDENNISENKSMNVYFTKYNNTIVGYYKDKKIRLVNQNIKFEDDTYIGNINSELITFNVAQNQEGATYVSGQVVVVEWVDGESTVPSVAPKMRFKSTDGTINMEVFVTATGTNTYYFDRFIEGIDTSKEYFFEIESGDERNVSEYRSMNVYFTNTEYNDTIVGKYKDKNIRLLKQKILFEDDTYIGNINSELITFNVGQNQAGATYVSGQVVVVEWVNGESTVPEVAPKMKFKSTDGEVELEVFVTPTGTNTYYFDRFIEGIDTSKEYYFEIESGDERNVSEYRSMNVYFTNTDYNDTIVGTYKGFNIRLLKQNIIFEE